MVYSQIGGEMSTLCKSYICGIFCLIGFLVNPGTSLCNVPESTTSISVLKSDTSGYVTVTGIVVDEMGAAIPNVMVTIAGTYRNARMTSVDGSFEIKVPGNQIFYLNFQHIIYLMKSVPINSERDTQGMKVVLKEWACIVDLIKNKVSCPPEETKNDLPFPKFKDTPEELMEVLINISKPVMPGGESGYLPRFHRQKNMVIYELGAKGKEIYGQYQGTFVVDTDGVVRKLVVDDQKTNKVAEILQDIFQKTGRWAPAINYGIPLATKFSFRVELP